MVLITACLNLFIRLWLLYYVRVAVVDVVFVALVVDVPVVALGVVILTCGRNFYQSHQINDIHTHTHKKKGSVC
jgi:hypothetical protein